MNVTKEAMFTAAVFISSIIQIFVAVRVFKKGRQNLSYLLFFGLSLVTLCWALLNYASVALAESTHLIYVVRAIMFFAVLQVALFYLFANAFPYVSGKSKVEVSTYAWFAVLAALTTLTPYMFRSAVVESGTIHIQAQVGIVLFTIFIAFSIVSAFRVLIRKFQAATGLRRRQLLILLVVSSINWIVIPLTNFVLTLTLKTLTFTKITPIYSLVFSSIVAYALLRHRLFDSKTVLRSSTIYMDSFLKSQKNRTADYYMLQTLIYESDSNHVALNFSGVKNLDEESVKLLNHLREYMAKQGKKIYFVGYTQKVFKQLQATAQ